MIIAPSILSCDFLNFKEEIDRLKGIKDLWLHLDVMDAHFVPNLTFGNTILKNLHKVTEHLLDAHFMVSDPEFFINDFKDIGIHNFTFHLEATDNPLSVIEKAKKVYPSVGISIKPGTPVESLTDDILNQVDLILIMSVEPGFGGQKFMPNSYEKINYLKNYREKNNLSFIIQVDGGVSDQNSKELANEGADNLVAGSYVFKEPERNYRLRIENLR